MLVARRYVVKPPVGMLGFDVTRDLISGFPADERGGSTDMLSLLILVAVLTALLIAAVVKPANALVSVISLDVLDQWAAMAHPFFAGHSYIINVFIGAMVLMAASAEYLRGRRDPLAVSWTWKLVLLLYAYALVSTVWSPLDPAGGAGADAFKTAAPYLLTYLVLTPLLARRVDDLRAPFLLLLFIGPIILAAILAFGQFGSRGLVVEGSEDPTNPLPLAQYGALITILFVITSWRKRSPWVKIALPFVALMGIWIIFRSQSRGPLIALAITLVIVWLHVYPGRITKRMGAALGGALFLGLVVYVALDAVPSAERWSSDQMSDDLGGRWAMAAGLLDAWFSDPATILFGLGNSAAYVIVGFYPHIVPLEILGEEGLIGFTLWLSILLLAYRSFRRLLRRFRDDGDVRIYIGVLFAFLVYLVLISLKQNQLLSSGPMFMYAVLMSNFYAVIERVERRRRPRDRLGLGPVSRPQE